MGGARLGSGRKLAFQFVIGSAVLIGLVFLYNNIMMSINLSTDEFPNLADVPSQSINIPDIAIILNHYCLREIFTDTAALVMQFEELSGINFENKYVSTNLPNGINKNFKPVGDSKLLTLLANKFHDAGILVLINNNAVSICDYSHVSSPDKLMSFLANVHHNKFNNDGGFYRYDPLPFFESIHSEQKRETIVLIIETTAQIFDENRSTLKRALKSYGNDMNKDIHIYFGSQFSEDDIRFIKNHLLIPHELSTVSKEYTECLDNLRPYCFYQNIDLIIEYDSQGRNKKIDYIEESLRDS